MLNCYTLFTLLLLTKKPTWTLNCKYVSDREFFIILTYDLEKDKVKLNQHVRGNLVQKLWFGHTHTAMSCTTWTTEMVGINCQGGIGHYFQSLFNYPIFLFFFMLGGLPPERP